MAKGANQGQKAPAAQAAPAKAPAPQVKKPPPVAQQAAPVSQPLPPPPPPQNHVATAAQLQDYSRRPWTNPHLKHFRRDGILVLTFRDDTEHIDLRAAIAVYRERLAAQNEKVRREEEEHDRRLVGALHDHHVVGGAGRAGAPVAAGGGAHHADPTASDLPGEARNTRAGALPIHGAATAAAGTTLSAASGNVIDKLREIVGSRGGGATVAPRSSVPPPPAGLGGAHRSDARGDAPGGMPAVARTSVQPHPHQQLRGGNLSSASPPVAPHLQSTAVQRNGPHNPTPPVVAPVAPAPEPVASPPVVSLYSDTTWAPTDIDWSNVGRIVAGGSSSAVPAAAPAPPPKSPAATFAVPQPVGMAHPHQQQQQQQHQQQLQQYQQQQQQQQQQAFASGQYPAASFTVTAADASNKAAPRAPAPVMASNTVASAQGFNAAAPAFTPGAQTQQAAAAYAAVAASQVTGQPQVTAAPGSMATMSSPTMHQGVTMAPSYYIMPQMYPAPQAAAQSYYYVSGATGGTQMATAASVATAGAAATGAGQYYMMSPQGGYVLAQPSQAMQYATPYAQGYAPATAAQAYGGQPAGAQPGRR